MKRFPGGFAVLAIVLLVGFLAGLACNQASNQPAGAADTAGEKITLNQPQGKEVQRFGCAIGLKENKAEYYNELHANPWPGVNKMIRECNIQKFSIFEGHIDGKLYLFYYMEYAGDDFAADMAKMAKDPTVQKWWKETDPCQRILPGTPEGDQWMTLEEVYRLAGLPKQEAKETP